MRIGIMSAMQEENALILEKISHAQHQIYAKREYVKGILWNHNVVMAFSRWGKVAAAMTATQLISKFDVEAILFTGVAGSCSKKVCIGDIVIATSLTQHDMDARPLCPRHEIPLINRAIFKTDESWSERAFVAAQNFLKHSNRQAKIHLGSISSGDKFFSSKGEVTELVERLPDTLCVEMEGAAVAQVCYEYSIPCAIIRTISDDGTANSPIDFQKFVSSVASIYSQGILQQMLTDRSYKEIENRA